MRIVDSQVHLWKANSPERPWPKGGLEPHLATPLSYQAMLAIMDEAGVEAAIVVPPSWEGDRIDYGLEAARSHPARFAVMGRIPLSDPSSRDLLPGWLDQKGMLGVRLTFVHEANRRRLDAGDFDWYWPIAERLRIPTMAHASENIPKIAAVAAAHPQLRLIIDHMGLSQKIAKEGRLNEAAASILPLAKYPEVCVKVSGLPDYSAQDFPFKDLREPVLRTIDAFGPRRCFWGTDISRMLKKCSYIDGVRFFLEGLGLASDELAWIMGRGLIEKLGWKELL